jgi:hypothetical protein
MRKIIVRFLALALVPLLLAGPAALAAEGFHAAYLSGFPDGSVRPLAAASREQTAQMLYGLLSPEARETVCTAETAFSDVPPGRWSYRAVSAMCELGVMPGRGDGSWRPEAALTGRMLSAVLHRLMGLRQAQAAFSPMREQLFVVPDGPVSRAALVSVLNRLFDRGPTSAFPDGAPDFRDNRDPSTWYYADVREAAAGHTYAKTDGAEVWTGLG